MAKTKEAKNYVYWYNKQNIKAKRDMALNMLFDLECYFF